MFIKSILHWEERGVESVFFAEQKSNSEILLMVLESLKWKIKFWKLTGYPDIAKSLASLHSEWNKLTESLEELHFMTRCELS